MASLSYLNEHRAWQRRVQNEITHRQTYRLNSAPFGGTRNQGATLCTSNPNHSHEDPAGKKYIPSPSKSAYGKTFSSQQDVPMLKEVRGKYARPAIARPDS